jgi:hypothetical protein
MVAETSFIGVERHKQGADVAKDGVVITGPSGHFPSNAVFASFALPFGAAFAVLNETPRAL